ncbi:MAG: DUF1828 domain-containing protein [Thermoplasmata archaeon]|nr:DUF1828 domain-containing protein [Thermoplasmata archaeon]
MTTVDEVRGLADSYYAWLRSGTDVRDAGGGTAVITTPILDRHNDCFELYVSGSGGSYRISDGGYLVQDLRMSGCDVTSGKRGEQFSSILRSFGICAEDGELSVDATDEDFPRREHCLLQAMMAVDDLHYTSKPNVAGMFMDDVLPWMVSAGISHSSNLTIRGRTLDHHIDFLLPDRGIRSPKRILQLMGRPDKSRLGTVLLMKEDLDDPEVYVLINDQGSPDGTVDRIRAACADMGMVPFLWSERESIPDAIARTFLPMHGA